VPFLLSFIYDRHAKKNCVVRRCVIPVLVNMQYVLAYSLCFYLPRDLGLVKSNFVKFGQIFIKKY
jgi:hypothetical protein